MLIQKIKIKNRLASSMETFSIDDKDLHLYRKSLINGYKLYITTD